MEKIIIKESKIEGKGVFANKDFKKGEVVLAWNTSRILSKEEISRLPEKEKGYIAHMEGRYIHMQPPERYVNHSCEPNTNCVGENDVAVRDIRKGEEITSDYSADLPEGFEMVCNCRSKNCRKIIRKN